EQHAVPSGVPLVLYVGGFSPHKNVEALLTAFARLVQPHEPASTDRAAAPHLVLVGETTQEVFYSCYAALRALIAQLRLEPYVTFTGHVPDGELVHLYSAATCLVLPSRDEGFGLPVVEAMACGTPVLAARTGSLPELV